jgi:hypothetical protein
LGKPLKAYSPGGLHYFFLKRIAREKEIFAKIKMLLGLTGKLAMTKGVSRHILKATANNIRRQPITINHVNKFFI